jgi:hypothetical protein
VSIDAVIAYAEQVGLDENEDAERIIRCASAAGFAFDAAELRTALAVRELLRRVHREEILRAELGAAGSPLGFLLELARQSGYGLDREDILAVLRALCTDAELTDDQLDHVAGGTLAFTPEVGDEVVVAFVQADTQRPFIIGSLWNGSDKAPSGA